MPEGCVLEFDGGSLRNGVLKGNGTKIKSPIVEIFNKIIISGSWKQENVYSNWFDFKSGKYDNINNFSNLFILATSDINTDVYINNKELYTSTNVIISSDSVARRGIQIPSNVYIHNSAIIKAIENDEERYSIFYVNNVENVIIEGGELIGDVQTHTGSTGEWGYGIALGGAKNVIIKNIIISECWGDGINVQALYSDYENKTTEGHCRNILIDNVKCLRNRRQGISIEGCFGIIIRNSEFSDTGSIKSTNPGAGIDIEPWFEEEIVTDVLIENCKILNNKTSLQIYGRNDLRGVRVNNCISDKGVWIRTSNITIDNWICTGENYNAYLAIWGTCKNIKVTNSIFYNEIYCRGNVQDLLISNCEFNMKFTNPWSGFALCFENFNSTGIYKNITISNNRFSDIYKSRFFHAASDDIMKIDFIGNEVVTTATFELKLGYGDFIGNSVVFKNNSKGIVLDNRTGNTVNVINNNIRFNKYTNFILEFDGDSIKSDDIAYDFKLYNNTISSENSFRVLGGESISDLYVDIHNCDFGKDISAELWRAVNVRYNSSCDLNSYFTKRITPVIYNAPANYCYLFVLPFKRGFVEFITSNLNVTNAELFNTCTVVSLNPDLKLVEICPTKIYRSNVRVDSTAMNFVPEFGTKVDEDKIYVYIKYNINILFGLRITATVNIQEKIEYSDIKFNSVPIPEDSVVFCKKIDAISYSSTTNMAFNITPYLGWKLWNINDKELVFNGNEWLNSDGTLESKVTII